MDVRSMLIKMLRQLVEDMLVIQQQGAGYYSCVSIARRYNKLLGQARILLGDNGLASTFQDIEEIEPKDPGEKMKVVQGIRIEIGQLIVLLDNMGGEPA